MRALDAVYAKRMQSSDAAKVGSIIYYESSDDAKTVEAFVKQSDLKHLPISQTEIE